MLAIYPKELMAAFGISGDLSDPGTFINSYIFQFLWPLVAAIVAIFLATRRRRGRRDAASSTCRCRPDCRGCRYLVASIGAQVVGARGPGGRDGRLDLARRPRHRAGLRRSSDLRWRASMPPRSGSRSRA